MIHLLVSLIVMVLIFGMAIYIIRLLPIPPPFDVVAQALVALVFLVILLDAFFGNGYLRLGLRSP